MWDIKDADEEGRIKKLRSRGRPRIIIAGDNDGNLRLGKRVFINYGCVIGLYGKVKIGDDCMIGNYVQILSVEHGIKPDKRINQQGPIKKITCIGCDVWIGGGAIITAGVNIGDHAIIGAGAVITHNVPDWEIWGGIPARKIGDRRTWKK